MNWFKYLFRKESQARIVMSKNLLGRPVHTPANYEGFARQGYSKNVVVFTAISKIATAAGGISWELYSKKGRGRRTELEEHPLLTLLDKPNPLQGTSSFIESVVAFNRIAGNSYIEANRGISDTGVPLELWPVRPDRMRVVPGKSGYVDRYVFTNGGYERSWEVDPVKLTSNILHWKTFNPTNDWYGLSPLEASMLSLDQNNAGQRWNLSLLQNSATPSGVLQMKVSDSNPRGELTDGQYTRLKEEFEKNYVGSKQAGRPMIIEGGLNWQSMSLSPKDMDFVNSKAVSATDLALALGVPPELMGLGAKTFNNYREARLAFYEETILPLMDSLKDSLNMWLAPAFGDGLVLDYNKDDIEALTWKREQKYTSLQSVDFLNQNEKRIAAGYDEKEGLDLYVIGGTLYSEEELKNFDSELDNEDDNESDDDDDDSELNESEGDEDADANTNEQNEDNDDEDDSKGWKSINLLNANEKKKAWRQQNKRRKRLSRSMERDVRDDFDSLTKKLEDTASKLKGKDSKIVEFALLQIESEWAPELKKTLKRHTRITVEDFGNMVLNEGKSLGFDRQHKANLRFASFIDLWTEARSGEQIKTITSTNQKRIRRVVGEWVNEAITAGDSLPELSKFIEAEFEELTPGRARTIARTEVQLASNNGAREAVKSLNIPGMFKEWVTADDDRVRDGDKGGADHAAMNGVEVSIEEKFTVPPDASMEGPGDPGTEADQVINCRCVLVYKSKNQGEL